MTSDQLGARPSDGVADAGQRWSAWRVVVGFGVVSLAGDIVYEGARSVYGPLLAGLGASAFVVGLVTGAGEAAALVLRLAFGPLADRTGRYWSLTLIGYALTAVCVPLLAVTPFVGGAGLALAIVLILAERSGKAARFTCPYHLWSYRLDGSYRRHDRVVIAGSPLRLFRLSPAGQRVVEAIEQQQPLPAKHGKLTDRLVEAGAIHPVHTGSTFTASDVTIVVPAFDVEPGAIRHDGKVIVVDDGSEPALSTAGRRTIRLPDHRRTGGSDDAPRCVRRYRRRNRRQLAGGAAAPLRRSTGRTRRATSSLDRRGNDHRRVRNG